MAKKAAVNKIILHTVLIIVSFICVFPVYVMISCSFKPLSEIYASSIAFPVRPTMDNYVRLFNYNSGIIIRTFFNSLYVASATTVLTLIIASMAGFAFSKFNFKGKNLLFFILLMTMMLPKELLITPQFLIFSKIGWLNTYKVQIIPFIANVFAMFMFRQYMMSIPDSLLEAAYIDGAGHFKVFAKIVVPTAAPAFGALGILQFLSMWNDYLYPRIMIDKMSLKPIMVVLPTLSENDSSSAALPYDLMMAGCSIVIIPMIIVFFCLQDKFLSSVTIGSVKE